MNKHTAELLEKHFDIAFAAPDGIKKLRELILMLAMQGKLVPQNPNDQPAGELLKEIEAEKQRLVKEGKVKKPKLLPPVTEEEEPYSLPQGWGWIRLGGLLDFEYGDNLPERKRTNSGEFPVYGSNGVVGSHNKAFINTQCIVIGRKGSAGALNLCLADGCCVTDVAYYCIPPKQIDLTFCFRLLHTLKLDSLGKGIKPGLNRNEAYILVIAIPPRKEQLRIVAKVDELMAHCDELEKLRTAQQGARLTVHAAAIKQLLSIAEPDQHRRAQAFLAEHFGKLYTVKENVAELRKAILQLAVMGKLVPQDPNDQPASELLKEIEAEKQRLVKEGKIKMPKPLPPVTEGERPYALPQGWEWVRLGNIGLINPRNNADDDMLAGFVPMPLIQEGYSEFHSFEERHWGDIKKGYTHFADGDVGMAKITPCFENMKSCVFSNLPSGIGAGTTELHIFRNEFVAVDPRYLLFFLKNPKFISTIAARMTGSAGQKRVPTPLFAKLELPLPPIFEQHRIAAKIDELMILCNSLDQQIGVATCKQSALLTALMLVKSQDDTTRETQQTSHSKAPVIDLATYRSSIGCYAINKLATAQYFGRTAAAKVMYLAQAHIGLDLDLKPEREAAGPLDTWIYDFERQGQERNWFEVNEKTLANGRKKTEYRCLSALSEPAAKAEALMTLDQKAEFDRLIYALADKTTEEVEIIATLFAVWNDFLIDGAQPTNTQIISDVRENWHERKARFTPAELDRWLNWLRRENIIPRGLPPRTVQQPRLNLDG